MSMVVSGLVVAMTPATSPSGIRDDPAADAAQLGDQLVVAGPVEHAGDDLVRLDPLGSGEGFDILRGRLRKVDDARRIARTDRQLLHVDVGRIEQPALHGGASTASALGAGLGSDRGAFERIERDVDPGALAGRAADLLADVQHRASSRLALADDDGAVDIEIVEGAAHGLDGGGVGFLLVTPADQARGGDGGRFGDAHHLQHQHAVQNRTRGDGRLLLVAHGVAHPSPRPGSWR